MVARMDGGITLVTEIEEIDQEGSGAQAVVAEMDGGITLMTEIEDTNPTAIVVEGDHPSAVVFSGHRTLQTAMVMKEDQLMSAVASRSTESAPQATKSWRDSSHFSQTWLSMNF